MKTKAALDYELKPSYAVTITVSDGSLTDTITVTINVRDLDETPSNVAPVFTDGESTTRSIAENSASDTNIGTAIDATDQDSEELAYLLSGTDASSFSIDGTSGQLKTSAALNFEDETSYTVTVTVSDGSLEDEITVTINVTNVNEAPMFADESITLEVAENTAAGTNLGSAVTAADPDADDTITYSLGGTDAASFDIGSTNGQLQTKAALNYEAKTSYTVIITATDSSDATDTITVTINVTDVNEAPSFAGETSTRAIDENTGAGVNIGDAIAATDSDTDDTLAYSLGGTNAASFDIGSTNGQLRTKAALNYETKNSYAVTVSVSDGNGGTDSIAVTINISDVNEAPAFAETSPTTRSIAENTAADTNIGSAVSATDPDADTLSYTLGGTDASTFSIVSTSGQLQTSGALDYETDASYTVTITVSDSVLTDTITVTINVTDVNENRAPSFSDSSFAYRISDIDDASVGDSIGTTVTASDADNDTLSYSLGGRDAALFDIDSSSGQLKITQSLIDHTTSVYSIKVIAKDGNGGTAEISGTIYVTRVAQQVSNNPPIFANGETTTRSIAENTASGQNIGSPVSAADDDIGDTLTYSLEGTDASSFSIVSTSGQLKTSAALDYEDKSSYTVTVKVMDDSGASNNSATITVTISVTDANDAPVFTDGSSTKRSIAENTASGQNIGSAVGATDADEDTITYTLSGTDATSFSIVSTSGQLQTSAALDYEDKSSYSVTVTATDDSGVSNNNATITVTINVTDANDAPVFSDGSGPTTRSVAENTASGQNIGSVVGATDADEDTITYTLSGTDAASFDIVSTSGQLQTSAALDYEDKSSYSVTVTATDDSGTNNNRATVTVTISITDVDENTAPTFTGSSISFRISDIASASVGDSIGLPITATDADEDTLTYSVGGDDVSKFGIDSSSAQLKVTQALIDDTSSSYSIKVIATDPDNATAEISVTIYVTRLATQQQNTNSAPVFDAGTSTTRYIAENTESGQDIGSPISASDDDTSDTLTYSLEGTDASSFSIVSTSGQLQTSAALDYEDKSSYTVTVKVMDDSGASNNSATITVTINVTNVDDPGVNDPPVFQYGSSVTLSVNKGERLGQSIRATDVDGDTLEYSLSGTDAALFSLNEDYEYYLQSNASLDYDGKSSYSVTMTVDDNNGGTDTVTITITDPAPEVEILTLASYDDIYSGTDDYEPDVDLVLELDSETGVVSAVPAACEPPDEFCLTISNLLNTSSLSVTHAKGVNYENSFHVSILFSEGVSGFEESELTLTNNTAGATINSGSWYPQKTWFGYVVDVDIDVTASGSVTINVAAGVATDSGGQSNTAAESATFTYTINLTEYPPWDVNEDGSVDDTDSALVTAALGQTGEDIEDERTDVNWDGTVDDDDVTLVTHHIEDENGEAPSIIGAFSLMDKKTLEKLDPVILQGYLDILRTESDGTPKYLRAIALLESILVTVLPSKTQLLANYPNPFNPETWIPYHLAKPSNVQISIYNMKGVVVRRLELGHQPAGYYTSRKRAAHWDGTNDVGERVTSGVYFYQLKIDNMSYLRKMVILK